MLLRRLLPALAALLLVPFGAGAAEIEEGKNYQVLATPVPTSIQDKIEVVEVFSYACPHCFNLEPTLEAWLKSGKPEQAAFVRVPASFSANYEVLARAYYTAQALGVLERVHAPLFDALHMHKRSLSNEAAIAGFFAEQGVDRDTFTKAWRSFEVDTKLRRAKQLTQQYRITGVPAIIVNGKYLTDVGMAGSPNALVEVINFLVKKEGGQG